MRIGNVRISGVSPRFFVILALVALAVIAFNVFRPESKAYDALVDPAFPTCPAVGSCKDALAKTLGSAKLQRSGWVGNFISAYGLKRPTLKSQMVANYSENAGLPLRLKVFIPDLDTQKARPDLTPLKYGYQFMPATFIAPDEATGLDGLAERASQDVADQPLQLGFPESRRPVPGQAYEITGLLWWRSDLLNPPDANDPDYDPQNLPTPSPV
jgi:hypothetical protein